VAKSRLPLKSERVSVIVIPAWAAWLLVHIFYLIGFENRLLVVLRWTISFVTRGRGARLIVQRGREADMSDL
jgi:NADH dehydrogenase